MAPKAKVKGQAPKAKAAPVESPAKASPTEKQVMTRGQAAAQKAATKAPEDSSNTQLALAASPPPSAMAASPAAKLTSPTGSSTLAIAKGGILNIGYNMDGDGSAPVLEGLVRLRRAGTMCDTAIVAAGGAKIAAHKIVLAAGSSTLEERLKLAQDGDLNLSTASHEAADILIRWLYGEISAAVFKPSTAQVNEEVLKLSSELALPRLSELCAARLATDITCANIVSRIRICEQFGLPDLRAALVRAITADKQVLATVSQDPATLAHPALMRELLAAVAARAFEVDDQAEPSKKRRTA